MPVCYIGDYGDYGKIMVINFDFPEFVGYVVRIIFVEATR